MKNLLLGTILILFSVNTSAKEITRNGNPLIYPFPPSKPFCQKPTKMEILNPSEKQAKALENLHKISLELYAKCRERERQYEINIKEYEKNKKEYEEEIAWRNKEIDHAKNYFFAFRPNYKLAIKHAEGPALAGNVYAIVLMVRSADAQTGLLAEKIRNKEINEENAKEYYKYTVMKYVWRRVFMESKDMKNFEVQDSEKWRKFEKETKAMEEFLKKAEGLQEADAEVEKICKRIYG